MKILNCVLLCICLVAQINALVIGIDLGSRFFKVGLLQAGKPYFVILNDESQRRTSTAISLLGGNEREFGTPSQNNAVKKPKETFLLSTTLLGRSESPDSLNWFKKSLLAYEFVVDEETNGYKIKIENQTYTIEEVIAMLLQHAQKLASTAAGTPIKDAVLAVPPYFTHHQRQALLNAANIAGLTVTGLINDNTAVALLYGVEKEADFKDSEKHRNVFFFDMGATSTKVSVVRYGGVQSKLDKKGNKTVGEYWIKSVGWDETVGALTFDNEIMDMIATEFNKKQGVVDGSEQDVRKNPVAVGKMRKNAEKAKEVLSTIAETTVTIEGLLNDIDFRLKISRDDLNQRCSESLARVTEIVKKALLDAELTVADIHSVEVVGGGSRIPGVQNILTSIFNLNLSVSLNGDDAVALGATLYAAKVSPAHRMREFVLRDVNPFPVHVRVVPITSESDDGTKATPSTPSSSSLIDSETEKEVFSVGCKVPINKKISLVRSEDFEMYLDYGKSAKLPIGTSHAISHYVFTGVSAAIKKYQDEIVSEENADVQKDGEDDQNEQQQAQQTQQQTQQEGTESQKKIKVSVSIQINPDGIIDISKTEAKVSLLSTEVEVEKKSNDVNEKKSDEAEEKKVEESEEKKVEESNEKKSDESNEKKVEEDNSSKTTQNDDSVNNENKSKQDGEESNNNNKKNESEPVVAQKKVKHLKLNVKSVPRSESDTLKILTEQQIKNSIKTLESLDRADSARRALAESKNELETRIYESRDFLQNTNNIEAVSLEEDREKMIEKLTQAEDWLYEAGLDATIEIYREKLIEVKDITSAVRFRYDEMIKRPEVILAAQEGVKFLLEKAKNWTTTKPWLNATEKGELVNKTLSFKKWLKDNEEKQSKASLLEEPILVSSEVARKMSTLQAAYKKMSKIPKPLPPKVSTNSTSSAGNSTKTKSDSFKKKPTTSSSSKKETEQKGKESKKKSKKEEQEEEEVEKPIGEEQENNNNNQEFEGEQFAEGGDDEQQQQEEGSEQGEDQEQQDDNEENQVPEKEL